MDAADVDALYAELKDDVAAVAEPLFEASAMFVKKRGAFLPHGAVLPEDGAVVLTMATPGVPGASGDRTNALEVLPLLHEALRQDARKRSLRAIGVAEDVTVTREGEPPTRAIKVLLEHRRGLCVALYLPFRKRWLRGWQMGRSFVVPARPEVEPWSGGGG